MIQELIQAALKVREHAYAPYSGFKVGAAILAENGEIYTGCNVENASYGLTVCAERVAVNKAISAGVRDFQGIAIVTDVRKPASPCGACRQVLAEFSPQMPVYLANLQGKVCKLSLEELLPDAFTPQRLREDIHL